MQNIHSTSDDLAGAYHHTCTKAISWPSILAGALTAISLSLILLTLGSGLGLASASAWVRSGPTPGGITCAMVIWLIIMQWVSSGFGGYLAGRLRSKYVSLHTDEAFFRDTAHGFLAWAVATVIVAIFSVSAVSSGIRAGAHVAGAAAGAAAMAAPEKPMGPPLVESNMYLVDTLFRSSHPAPTGDERETHGETVRILATDIKNGDVSQGDRAYLTQVVAARAGITQAEAAKRVDDTITQMKAAEEKAKQAAETARKAGATLSIFTFLSLLIGAFIASVAGALGGKCRDEY